jgi:transcriptional regulator with XRE-family HTH domain
MDTWNKRLATALAESDYTANALANAMGVSAPTVSAWIGAGTITPARNLTAENAIRVCQLLNIRPEWLLFREGSMRPTDQDNLTPEMWEIITELMEIDKIKGPVREDAIYFIKRLLKPEDKGSQQISNVG